MTERTENELAAIMKFCSTWFLHKFNKAQLMLNYFMLFISTLLKMIYICRRFLIIADLLLGVTGVSLFRVNAIALILVFVERVAWCFRSVVLAVEAMTFACIVVVTCRLASCIGVRIAIGSVVIVRIAVAL